MYELHWPWSLLLLPLPLLLARLPAVKSARSGLVRVPFYADLLGGMNAGTDGGRWWRNALLWVFFVLALSRPQWIGEPVPLPVQGRDLMLAIDISGSMEQPDMILAGRRVDRLTAVKSVAGDFIDRRAGDRIGLILFGENAYLQAPLTFDRATVKTLLLEAAIGLAGKATAIGDSIGLAVKKARETENPQRLLILLTDGRNTAGAIDPLKATELAAAEDMKIYTIGVGAERMVVNRMSTFQQTINPSADLDEPTLKKIAAMTGGRYFRARDLSELEQIYRLLDEMEPLAEEAQFHRPVEELFYWPLLLGLLALMASLFLRGGTDVV